MTQDENKTAERQDANSQAQDGSLSRKPRGRRPGRRNPQTKQKAAPQAAQENTKQQPQAQAAEQTPAVTSNSRGQRRGQKNSKTASSPKAAAKTEAEPKIKEQKPKERQKTASPRGRSTAKQPKNKVPVRIIPLGGLNEIGKNMTLYECGGDMFLVDCGLAFPDDEMLGVDLVIPDFTYVERNREKIRGVVLTHGHEDHIGALPYLLKLLDVPVYGTRLTLGLVEGKLKEHNLLNKAKLICTKPGDVVQMGCMSVEFIRVNHSIPDACAMAIHTPAGVIVQTGDFKIDYSPIEGDIIDLARFGELGSQGVLALLADSTNAEKPGSTMSERKVGESFDNLFNQAQNKRILVATFASNIHRIQQVISCAQKYGRKVAVSGRSMINAVTKALELSYLHVPDGLLIDIDMVGRYPDNQIVLITTGSQGEPMSALSRMAMGDHRKISITPNDFIIISANPIPGNEKTVGRVVNELMKLGAEVIYEKMYEVHVSGHACQDELRLMLGLTRPKFFMPVHGEYKQLKKHAGLASSLGIPKENIFIGDIGQVLETNGEEMKFTGTVPAGRVLVDGLGVGDVGSIVLRDRKHLAQDGLIVAVVAMETESGAIVAGPDLVSRGFVYVREAETMMAEARKICRDVIEECSDGGMREWSGMKTRIRDELSDYFYNKTKRSPMILPVIQQI